MRRRALFVLAIAAACGPARASTPARVADVDDPREAKRVLDATFARYLTTPCPAIAGVERADTWTKLDALQAAMRRRGLFRPEVRQRISGSFTRAGADETLYVVAIGDCVGNGWDAYVDVVFARGGRTPVARIAHGDWGASRYRVVAVERAAGEDRLVVTSNGRTRTVRLVRGAWVELTP